MAKTVRSRDGSSMAAMTRRLSRAERLAITETAKRREIENAYADVEASLSEWQGVAQQASDRIRHQGRTIADQRAELEHAQAVNDELRHQLDRAALVLGSIENLTATAKRDVQHEAMQVPLPTLRHIGTFRAGQEDARQAFERTKLDAGETVGTALDDIKEGHVGHMSVGRSDR